MPVEKPKLKSIYSDILRGYSVIHHHNRPIYVKHFNTLDSAEIDLIYDEYFEKARKKELPTSEEQENSLIEIGDWSQEQNRKIFDLETYLKGLNLTKSKLWKEQDLNRIKSEIAKAENDLNTLKIEKYTLLGTTAETYAAKKLNEFYIYNTLYSASDLGERLFTKDEFEELDNHVLSALVELYNVKSENFNENNLKGVALSSFFSNFFYLAEDNVFNFYGKPIIKLTFYQMQLFMFGKYFKGMFSDSKTRPPEHIMEDPEKVIEWFNSSKNINELIEKNQKSSETGSVSLVGASKDDLKRAGVTTTKNKVNLFEEAKKRNGQLSMEEIIRLEMGS